MTQEDRELLLKDLCARLPYGVKVYAGEDLAMTLKQIDYKGFCESWENEDLKCHSRWMLPYLRSLPSMTKEEKEELERLIDEKLNGIEQEDDEYAPWVLHYTTGIRNSIGGEKFYFDDMSFIYDWLNSHHFDYRGLISKGLAIKVTPENNPYKV